MANPCEALLSRASDLAADILRTVSNETVQDSVQALCRLMPVLADVVELSYDSEVRDSAMAAIEVAARQARRT